jgi:hypothetical protein
MSGYVHVLSRSIRSQNEDWNLFHHLTLTLSHLMQTVVTIVEDDTKTAPTLSVVAHGPFPVAQVHRGLVSQSGSSVDIRNVRLSIIYASQDPLWRAATPWKAGQRAESRARLSTLSCTHYLALPMTRFPLPLHSKH